MAGRIRAELARPFAVLGHQVRISASVGVTVGDSESSESLLQEADRSMFAAKRSGRGRIDVYSEALGHDRGRPGRRARGARRRPASAASCGPTTSRSSTCAAARSSRGRRSCGGRTRSGACSGPRRSWRRRPQPAGCRARREGAAAGLRDGRRMDRRVRGARQRLGAAPGRAGVRRVRRAVPRGFGAAAVPAGAGDHREPGAGRVPFHARVHRRALGHGRRAVPRRLRHRLLERHRTAQAADRRVQDRPLVRRRGAGRTRPARRWWTA